HIYPYWLCFRQARIAVYIGPVHTLDGFFYDTLEVLVTNSQDFHWTDCRDEDVALRIDHQDIVECRAAPQPKPDAITDGHEIVRIELGRPLPSEGSGEEGRAKDLAVTVCRAHG